MNKLEKPDKSLIKEEGTYKGTVTEVEGNEAVVRIYKEDGSYIQEVFPLSLFKGEKVEENDIFKYHIWELKNGQIGGFFEVIDSPPRPLSEKKLRELENLSKKLKINGEKLKQK